MLRCGKGFTQLPSQRAGHGGVGLQRRGPGPAHPKRPEPDGWWVGRGCHAVLELRLSVLLPSSSLWGLFSIAARHVSSRQSV